MGKKTLSVSKVASSLRRMAEDPSEFSDLVDNWNAAFEFEGTQPPKSELDALDAVVDETFQMIASDEDGVVEPRLKQMINALPYAVLVTRAEGKVLEMNEVALAQLPISPGEEIDEINYDLDGGASLSDMVRAGLDGRNSIETVSLMRAENGATGRPATLVFMPKVDHEKNRMLIFIIDPQWREEIQAFLARAYELTAAETGVLAAFIDGYSLKEISQLRGTSLVTVRTQFQSIMSKSGARTQADLMRSALAISQFFREVIPVADVARHPFRKNFLVLGEKGRSIDVTLAGEFSGNLVVSVGDATFQNYPAKIEAEFRLAGLCFASLCRPGIGQTDPPDENQDYIEVLAKDICTVADQLGHQKIVLMANNMSSVLAYMVAPLLAGRLHGLIIKSTLVPAPALSGNGVRSPWARALMRAVGQSSGMYRAIIFSAIKAWKVLGSRRLFLMQLKGFEPDLKVADNPEVINEFDRAMHSTLAQGTNYPVLVFEYAARDWNENIDRCPAPIILLQGRHDPSSDYSTIRGFALKHPDKIQLHTFEDGGYLTFLTHTKEFVAKIVSAFANPSH